MEGRFLTLLDRRFLRFFVCLYEMTRSADACVVSRFENAQSRLPVCDLLTLLSISVAEACLLGSTEFREGFSLFDKGPFRRLLSYVNH